MPKTKREYLSNFETVLLPVFEGILRDDVTEFLPYVFQVLSLLLEVRDEGIQGPFYMALFPLLINPILWDRPGEVFMHFTFCSFIFALFVFILLFVCF